MWTFEEAMEIGEQGIGIVARREKAHARICRGTKHQGFITTMKIRWIKDGKTEEDGRRSQMFHVGKSFID